jgi:hypothetical protein
MDDKNRRRFICTATPHAVGKLIFGSRLRADGISRRYELDLTNSEEHRYQP